jgi:hypothetical protein
MWKVILKYFRLWPTTAADDINAALAGFTSAKAQLDAAAAKATAEIEASWTRVEEAYVEYVEVRANEAGVRYEADLVLGKAVNASQAIAALVGE